MGRTIIGLVQLAQQYGPGQSGQGASPLRASELPRSFIGIPPTTLEPGDTAEIQCDVQREFRPDRLMLAAIGADTYTDVQDIRVGTVSLNASEHPVPVEAFYPVATGVSIRATETAIPAIGIQLVVSLDAGAGEVTSLVRGAFFGPSAAPGSGQGGPATVDGKVAGIVGGDGSDPLASDLPQSFIGFPRTSLPAAGVRVNTTIRPQRDLRPDRIVFAQRMSADCLMYDLRVGTVSLNASMNPVPCQCFGILSFGNRLRPPVTANPSVGITLSVANTHASVAVIQGGAIFGPSQYATS